MLILSSVYADNPYLVREGTANRLMGFYGSMATYLLGSDPNSAVFWYSNVDHTCRSVNNKRAKKSSMLTSICRLSLFSRLKKSHLLVMVAYPSVLKEYTVVGRLLSSFDLVFSILALKLSNRNSKLVIDDFDPPVELNAAFSANPPSIISIILRRSIDIFCLKMASEIIVVTDSYRRYLSNAYKISLKKFTVVPNGALIKCISYEPPRFVRPITVLYSGSAAKTKNFDKLLDCISELRVKGFPLELQVAGSEMALPDWAHNIQTDWYSYVKNVLTKADICVIPYPSDKLHFAYTLPAKLADYMAAGKPIVATDALETALVITKYDCGLIAKDWVDFSRKIEKLCCSPNLALKLGEHGRKAAEDFLNYEILAKTYLKKVLSNFNYVGY